MNEIMNSQFLLIAPLIVASILNIVSAAFVLKKERTNVSFWFTILMATITVWSVCYGLELIFSSEMITLFFAKLKYVGIVFSPVAWLFFSLSYTKKSFFITKKSIISLSIIPLISLSIILTNSIHHLFWKTITFTGTENLRLVSGSVNMFFWIHTIYSYVLILIGMAYLLSMLFRTKDIFTKQNMLLLVGVLTPFVGNIFIVFDILRLPYGYDLTPFLFVLSGVAFSIAIVYFKFLELIPAAREEIFEHVKQAIFVLNTNLKIIDKNMLADELLKQGFLSASNERVIGNSIDVLFQDVFPNGLFHDVGIKIRTIPLKNNEKNRWFEISMNPIYDKHDNLDGHLVTLDDVTLQKEMEKKLKNKIDELKQFKKVTLNRELKMIELKKHIKQLQGNNDGDDLK